MSTFDLSTYGVEPVIRPRSTQLIARDDKTVAVTVQTRAALAPSDVFTLVVPMDLSLIFKGWGPFPGVRGVANQTAAWDHAGPSRNPQLSDGSTATETLTEYTVGQSFAYELTEFTGVLGRLVSGIRGEWTFTPDGPGTLIRWTYEFKPLPGRHVLLRLAVAPLWRRYMKQAVESAARYSEERYARGTPVASPPDKLDSFAASLLIQVT